MVRRKRGKLSDEDREIWSRVARTTDPLHPLDPPAPPPEFQPDPVTVSAPLARVAVARPLRPLTRIGGAGFEARVTVNLATDPMRAAETPGNQMDRRNFERLRKGKMRPDARLDLHGMTADQAHGELVAFIHRCHAAGKRLALVITGKGNTTRDEGGIMPTRQGLLRHSLPHWLDAPHLRPMILEITPAHARHGGGGAYYVYLRRRR